MVRTPSTMLPLGTIAPDFSLPNVDGRMVGYADAAGLRGTVVMFICNHCPFVKHVADELARLGRDACTPDFYLFDANRRLVYRGQLDPSRPGSDVPVTGRDLRAAVDALLAGQPPVAEQIPSLGCNIKWKAGNHPAYFHP